MSSLTTSRRPTAYTAGRRYCSEGRPQGRVSDARSARGSGGSTGAGPATGPAGAHGRRCRRGPDRTFSRWGTGRIARTASARRAMGPAAGAWVAALAVRAPDGVPGATAPESALPATASVCCRARPARRSAWPAMAREQWTPRRRRIPLRAGARYASEPGPARTLFSVRTAGSGGRW